ncbi:DUF1579 family protein [Paenibacillus piri]|nr:DUF1579 family protein [Paenibacillus piri]
MDDKRLTAQLAMERLQPFIGKWKTKGTIVLPTGAEVRLDADDTYEWLPGGYFLIHHVNGLMGEDEVKAIEIIGFHEDDDMYVTTSYDNRGVVANYKAQLHERDWTIIGSTERFRGSFGEDGRTLAGVWELAGDGAEWKKWMDIVLTKY